MIAGGVDGPVVEDVGQQKTTMTAARANETHTSMSQSTSPNASENVQMNCEMAAHRQSLLRVAMSGEGGGGATSAATGATASGGGLRFGIGVG